MMMLLVDELDHRVKQLLKVNEVDDLLSNEAPSEPSDKSSVVRFDLPIRFRIARTHPDPMRAELGQARAKRHGVKDARAVCVEQVGQPPALCGEPKDTHGGAQIGRGSDDRGQNGARGIVEDREDVDVDRPSVGESEPDRPLGIGVPDLVRATRDESATPLSVLACAHKPLVRRVLRESALQCRTCHTNPTTRERERGIGMQMDEENRDRQLWLLGDKLDRPLHDFFGQPRLGFSLVLTDGGLEGREPGMLVGADPAIERRGRRGSRVS